MNDDLQAPIPSDHNCRRRAYLIIGLIYSAALIADQVVTDWPLIRTWFQ